MTERQIIDSVLDLLSDESKWTKGALARDSNGAEIDFDSPNACCWCLGGALDFSYVQDCASTMTVEDHILLEVYEAGFTGIPGFNDSPRTTFSDVRALLLKVREEKIVRSLRLF